MASSGALLAPGSARSLPWMRRNQSVTPAALEEAKKTCEASLAQFEKALHNHNPQLKLRFEKLCKQKAADLGDIVTTVDEIVAAATKRHPTNDRKFATRFIRLFERIREFAIIGDVFVGGAQNMVVSGVWGSVRIAIEISLSWMTFYEKVSEMLFRIGKFSEVNAEFATLFPRSRKLQALACEYMTVVVDITTQIVVHAKKNMFQQALSAFVSRFELDFKDLESKLNTIAWSIKQHADIEAQYINHNAHSLTQRLAHETMAVVKGISATNQKERRRTLKSEVLHSLSSHEDRVRPAWQRQYSKGVSSWLLNMQEYKMWKSSKESSCLWLEGNLGFGKSVTVASVVADLSVMGGTDLDQPQGLSTLSYYFCDDTHHRANKASEIIGSIVRQVLQATVIEPSFDAYVAELRSLDMWDSSPEACVDLLIKITPQTWSGFFVLDGMDHCTAYEIDTVVREFSRLSAHRQVLLLVSSRTNWKLFEKVKTFLKRCVDVTHVSMERVDRESEAINYINTEISNWEDGLTSSADEQAISSRLLSGWGGMFLWLDLQLQMIHDELRSGIEVMGILARLPDDLSDIYERILAPVAARSDRFTRTILELVATADPPLSLKELRVAANIRPGVLEWHPADLIAIPSAFCRRYGGYVLEVDEDDDKVHFIHPSVAIHLGQPTQSMQTNTLHFDIKEAQERLGLICVTLLNFKSMHQNVALQRHSADTRVAEPLAWAADSIAGDKQLTRWLHSVYKNAKGSPGSSVHVPTFLYDVATQTAARCVPSDLLDYARAHWLDATRFLKMEEPKVALWNSVAKGNAPYGRLPQHLKDPKTGIIWAIEEAHRPLFSYHCSDPRLLNFGMNHRSYVQLHRLLFFAWTDFSIQGSFPLPFLWWLLEDWAVYEQTDDAYWTPIMLLLFSPSSMNATSKPLSGTGILRSHALKLLPLVLKSTQDIGDFRNYIQMLKPHVGLGGSECGIVSLLLVYHTGVDVERRLKVMLELGVNPDRRGHLKEPADGTKKGSPQERKDRASSMTWDVTDIPDSSGAGATVLMAAAKDNNVAVVQILLEFSVEKVGHDAFEYWNTALLYAAANGAADVLAWIISQLDPLSPLKAILESPGRPYLAGETALFYALHTSHKNGPLCARILFEAGARRLLISGENTQWVLCTSKDQPFPTSLMTDLPKVNVIHEDDGTVSIPNEFILYALEMEGTTARRARYR